MSRPGSLVALPSLLLALAAACAPAGGPDAGPDDDAGPGGDAGIIYRACAQEEECEYLGPGHMCMNGGCMLMDIHGPVVVVPAPSVQDTAPVRLTDLDPDPGVFQAELIATPASVELVPGQPASALVYREADASASRIPGPLIDVVAGTLLRIHFRNDLDAVTSIHWHGLVLPNEMDGMPMELGAIEPGADFTFEFVARDSALYWYHPHFDGDVQIEGGLYGLLVVRGPDEPVVGTDVDVERIFAIDDVLLDDDGDIAPPDDGPAVHEDGIMTFQGMMGRQGNRLLVNGRINPYLDVTAGTVERWRLVNTANSRFFRLALPGHTFTIIGTDGGLVPSPRVVDEILMAPGERYDLLVAMTGTPSSEVPLQTLHHERGHDMADPGVLQLAHLAYAATAKVPATPMPLTSRAIAPLQGTAVAAHREVLDEVVLRGGKVGMTLNDELWPDVTALTATLGDTETWEIVNDADMDHPFHLHGFPFQALSLQPVGGAVVDETFLAWKDTFIVPPQTTLRFVVKYDGFPGDWMFHCHILEHAEQGMMGMIMVMP